MKVRDEGDGRETESGRDKLRRLKKSGKRLTLKQCANPTFDFRVPVRRTVSRRNRPEPAYQWVTITEGYAKVCVTYFLSDGLLRIMTYQPCGAQLFSKVVQTRRELTRALLEADRAHKRLEAKFMRQHMPRHKHCRHKR